VTMNLRRQMQNHVTAARKDGCAIDRIYAGMTNAAGAWDPSSGVTSQRVVASVDLHIAELG
jgi:hypothetical protein